MKLISLVVPAYNEEENLPRVFEEITQLRARLTQYAFEILLVDNASTDRTGELARALCGTDASWKYVRFSRNFGSEASIAAGMRLCKGDACVILFSDLQDPPAEIPRLIEKWEQGFQIVYGIYEGREHATAWKRFLVARYYALVEKISNPPLIPFAGDFRIYDRTVIDVLNRMRERNRYMRGLSQWVGFRTGKIIYQRHPRRAGKSKAPFFYMFGFAFNVIINFSDKPLKLFIWLGLGVIGLSFALTVILVYSRIFSNAIPGLTTTQVLLAFNLGFNALSFGVLGEYISKIYSETKGRPLWIVQESAGLDIGGNELG